MHSRVKYALAISHAARAPGHSDSRGSASASWFALAVLAARQHSDGCQVLAQNTTRETSSSLSTRVQTSLSEGAVLSFCYSQLSHVLFPLLSHYRNPAGDTEQPLARALQKRQTKAGMGLGSRRRYV